jgi:hypothetical protein
MVWGEHRSAQSIPRSSACRAPADRQQAVAADLLHSLTSAIRSTSHAVN